MSQTLTAPAVSPAAAGLPAIDPVLSKPGELIRDDRLVKIRERSLAGKRLTIAEGEVLYTTPDVWGVIEIADAVRRKLHGDVAYYNINKHLNYSNVCALSCKFCEFYRKKDDDGAYTRDLDYIREQAKEALASGATEMHIVGGLHPYLEWNYYPDMLRAIKEVAPDLHLKAFTAVEVVHLAKIAKKFKRDDRKAGIRWVLQELKDAGLGSLPGGGAEVFDDRVHDEAYKGKIRSDVWLDVHTVAHELGLNSNCTILYGHIEQRRERLVHMDMLRRAQDMALARLGYEIEPGSAPTADQKTEWDGEIDAEWPGEITLTRDGVTQPTPDGSIIDGQDARPTKGGYFQTIIPLPFFPDGSELENLAGPSGIENLRTIAISRLMLDNFPHVKAFWIMQTLPMSQVMLEAGADDIDGTVVWYDITKVGGSSTHQETTVWDLTKAISEAGFEPVERDTLYRRVVRDGKDWRLG